MTSGNKTTLEEDLRSPLDGSEAVYVSKPGQDFRTTTQDIANLGGGGTPGGPINAVQFNNPLGTFDGTLDFRWVTGTGLTIGGATETLGVVTPGAGEHVAIGNYGVIDNPYISPGDSVNGFSFPALVAVVISDFISGDLSVDGASYGLASYPGFKHTGVAGSGQISGIDVEPNINSDSTGPITNFAGMTLFPNNSAPCPIGLMTGITGNASNSADGATIGLLAGLNFVASNFGAATITDIQGLATNVFSIAGTITNSTTAVLSTPQLAGTTVTNVLGLNIEDHAAIGSAQSYNLVSRNAGYLGTMASTAGGNLFQGDSAMGNFADVDTVNFAPGDPTQSFTVALSPMALTINAYRVGDLSALAPYEVCELQVFTGNKHTGANPAFVYGTDIEPVINSDSTGPWGEANGIFGGIINFGSGTIDSFGALHYRVTNDGTANVTTEMYGVKVGTLARANGATTALMYGFGLETPEINGGATVTTYYGQTLPAPVVSGGGAVTNVVGTNIPDHSAIGGTQSYNLVSRNAGYLGAMSSKVGGNLFQGHVAIGNYADTDNAIYAPGDSVEEFPTGTGPIPLLINEFFGPDGGTGIVNYVTWESTSSNFFNMWGMDTQAVTSTDSTATAVSLVGHNFQATNFGQGNIDGFGRGTVVGANCFANHQGGGHVNLIIGAQCFADTSRSFGGANGTCDYIIGVLAEASAQAITAGTAVFGIEAGISAQKNGSFNVTVPLGVGVEIDQAFSNFTSGFTRLVGLRVGDQSNTVNNGTSAYNILSLNDGYLGTMASTAGGNLFQGHVAVGNYADVNTHVFAPGDPVNAFPTNANDVLCVSDYITGDFSNLLRETLTVFPGIRHTGAGHADYYCAVFIPTINSNSTGDFFDHVAGFFQPINYGSGDISDMNGIVGAADNEGSGNIFNLFGLSFLSAHHGTGTVTNLVGAQTQNEMSAASTTTNAYTFRASAPAGAGNAANVVGMLLRDHSVKGSTTSYNLLSENSGYLGTMASKAGGNLFQGHSAFGNNSDVQDATLIQAYEVLSGDLSGVFAETLAAYTDLTHTGVTNADIFGIDQEVFITASSTGPLGNAWGLSYFIYNEGAGDIGFLFGAAGEADHFGSGNVAFNIGVRGLSALGGALGGDATDVAGVQGYIHYSSNATFTNGYTFWAPTPRDNGGGATIANLYGLNVEDHSGIGGTRSWNIWSQGAGSINRFDGTIQMTEITALAAPAANTANLFVRDNGGGKTQLVVRFPTGAIQVIATEP